MPVQICHMPHPELITWLKSHWSDDKSNWSFWVKSWDWSRCVHHRSEMPQLVLLQSTASSKNMASEFKLLKWNTSECTNGCHVISDIWEDQTPSFFPSVKYDIESHKHEFLNVWDSPLVVLHVRPLCVLQNEPKLKFRLHLSKLKQTVRLYYEL